MRARLVKAFDQFHDVRSENHLRWPALRRLEVDILVDLGGHTRDSRIEIASHRPCPVQVSYLGYPGTMGADFIDYVIADPVVVPADQQPFFSEKILHLPGSFFVSDTTRSGEPALAPRGNGTARTRDLSSAASTELAPSPPFSRSGCGSWPLFRKSLLWLKEMAVTRR